MCDGNKNKGDTFYTVWLAFSTDVTYDHNRKTESGGFSKPYHIQSNNIGQVTRKKPSIVLIDRF